MVFTVIMHVEVSGYEDLELLNLLASIIRCDVFKQKVVYFLAHLALYFSGFDAHDF